MKMKFLVAALALVGAGAAQAAASLPNSATGGSLVFEAWDGTNSYSEVLGTYAFNNVFNAAGNAGVAGNTSISLGSAFAAFTGNSSLQWHVVAGKNANDSTSRGGLMSTWNATATPSINNNAVGNAVTGLNNFYNNLNTLIGSGSSGVVNANTDPAYAGRTVWGGNFGVPVFTTPGNAVTGFFSGAIDGTTVYAPGTGVGAFYSFVNSGLSGTSQSTKALYGNAQGNGAWILQSNGTLTYHTADVATAPVPLPAAAWLFGSGLLGLVGIGRRRNKQG